MSKAELTERNKDVYFAVAESEDHRGSFDKIYNMERMVTRESIHEYPIKDYADVEKYIRENISTHKDIYIMKCVKVVSLDIKEA